MIINLRWPHRCRGKVRPTTITECGAEHVCNKCWKSFYVQYTTIGQITRAHLYLTIKQSNKETGKFLNDL